MTWSSKDRLRGPITKVRGTTGTVQSFRGPSYAVSIPRPIRMGAGSSYQNPKERVVKFRASPSSCAKERGLGVLFLFWFDFFNLILLRLVLL